MDAQQPWQVNAGGSNGHLHVYEYGMALHNEQTEVYRWISYDLNVPANTVVTDLPAKVVREGRHTIYAITFPWQKVGLQEIPRPGTRIGFSLIVNDRGPNGIRRGLRLGDGLLDSKNPADYEWLWTR